MKKISLVRTFVGTSFNFLFFFLFSNDFREHRAGEKFESGISPQQLLLTR